MHGAAAVGGPVGEGFQVVAIFPGQLEEFLRIKIGGLLAEEGFETPLNERAFPGLQTVTAGGEPVKL